MKLTRYLCIAATAFSLIIPATLRAATSTAHLTISVTIRPWLKLSTDQLVTSYQVTGADLLRGYVDLPGSALVTVTTNDRKPVAITLASADGQTVLLRESGSGSFPATAGALDIGRQRPGVASVTKLDYRVILPEGAKTGSYPLNVAISSHAY